MSVYRQGCSFYVNSAKELNCFKTLDSRSTDRKAELVSMLGSPVLAKIRACLHEDIWELLRTGLGSEPDTSLAVRPRVENSSLQAPFVLSHWVVIGSHYMMSLKNLPQCRI